jgi:hypothetical protein
MNSQQNNIENYKKAAKKVQDIKGFYSHLFWYIVINVMLLFLNLKYSPEHLWFFYTTLGWGIGVIGHAVGVFGNNIWLSKEWENRQLDKIIQEEKNKQTQNWE